MTCGDVGLLYPFQLCLVCGYLDEDANAFETVCCRFFSTNLLHPIGGERASPFCIQQATAKDAANKMTCVKDMSHRPVIVAYLGSFNIK